MSVAIEVKETSAWVSKTKMEADGISVKQLLASMGYVQIDGIPHRVTKLIDVDTGLEIT